MRIPEREIRYAALKALLNSESGSLTTSQLIALLSGQMNPTGRDVRLGRNRNDTLFSQKVRNIISHRHNGQGLVARGLVVYDAQTETLTITAQGRALAQKL